MEPHNIVLAENSLAKAEQALKDGHINLETSLSLAQNRAYYAVFYTVLALGYLDDFITSKHHQLMGWFNKKYIYEDKVFSHSIVKIYTTLMRKRETFDYDVTQNPIKEDVIKDLQDAETFITTLKPYIIERISK
ncbi:MAG: HEPN domain-containing protein [Candidatus Gastranaerophilaceae bacterium]|jgi:uncharacterized protein (UPF0332 family)